MVFPIKTTLTHCSVKFKHNLELLLVEMFENWPYGFKKIYQTLWKKITQQPCIVCPQKRQTLLLDNIYVSSVQGHTVFFCA